MVENLPVSRDRRVARQAAALVAAGHDVSVICPWDTGTGSQNSDDLAEVEVLDFKIPAERPGVGGFFTEYSVAWVRMMQLLVKARRRGPIDVVQVCNPPDIFFVHGWLAHRFGARFVFDQHDLAPELFETRFGTEGFLHRLLAWSEALTYRVADRVIATNESYRQVAIERGGLQPEHVKVVRNGPDAQLMKRGEIDLALRGGRSHLVAWMGNMGPQDGVDDAVRAIDHLVHQIRRTDTSFVFIGKGEELDAVRRLATELKVDDYVTFTGWVTDEEAFAWLSAADVGLSADPPGPLNDLSTMNKTMEYMSFELPVVAHDLTETRFSAGDAGIYAKSGDPSGLAVAIDELLSTPGHMVEMGQEGRHRIEAELAWRHQRQSYVDMYAELTGKHHKPTVNHHNDVPEDQASPNNGHVSDHGGRNVATI